MAYEFDILQPSCSLFVPRPPHVAASGFQLSVRNVVDAFNDRCGTASPYQSPSSVELWGVVLTRLHEQQGLFEIVFRSPVAATKAFATCYDAPLSGIVPPFTLSFLFKTCPTSYARSYVFDMTCSPRPSHDLLYDELIRFGPIFRIFDQLVWFWDNVDATNAVRNKRSGSWNFHGTVVPTAIRVRAFDHLPGPYAQRRPSTISPALAEDIQTFIHKVSTRPPVAVFLEGDWTSMTLRFETPELATQAKQSFLSHIFPVNLQCEYLEGPLDMSPAKHTEHYMRPPSPPPVVTIVDCHEESRPTSRSGSLTPPPYPLPCSPRTQSESSAPSRLMTPESWTTEAPSFARSATSSAPSCGLERALLRAEERAESRIDALIDAREKWAALSMQLRYSEAEAERYKAENKSLRERASQQGGDNQTQQFHSRLEHVKAQQRRTNDNNDSDSGSSDTLSAASTTKTEQLARRAEAAEEALDVERHEWGTEKCRLQDQLSAWESRRNEWEMDKHEMELQVESLQSELECLTKLLHEADMQGVDLAHDLHCKTEQIDRERWDWIEEKAELQDQLAAWESRREEWDTEKRELDLHAQALQLDLADCSRMLHDSESMQQRQNERAAEDAEIIKDLQVRLAAAQKAQQRVQDMDAIMLDREEEWSAEKEGLELQVSDLCAKNAELQTEKIDLAEKLEKCQKDMDNQSIVESELRELFHESETRGDRCEEALEAAIGDQSRTAKQLDEAIEEKATLCAERDELAKWVTDLESVAKEKEVAMNDLETKEQSIAGLTHSLEERTTELQDAQEKTKLIKAALSRTIDDCKADLARGAEEYGKLASQFSKSKEEATAAAAKKDAAVEMSEKTRGLIEKRLAAREEELALKAKDLGVAQRKVNELSRELKKEKDATGKVRQTPGDNPAQGWRSRTALIASEYVPWVPAGSTGSQRPRSWAALTGPETS